MTTGFRRRGPATEVTQTVTVPEKETRPQGSVGKSTVQKTSGGKSNFIKLGAIVEKKDGSVYLKFDANSTAEITVNGKPLKNFQIEDPTLKYDRMVASGSMTEAQADDAAAKVPAYVLYEVTAQVE